MKVSLITLVCTAGATELCCQAETAECKACNAGMHTQQYCGLHRSTPGCDDICCDQGCSALCKRVTAGHIKRTTRCPFKVVDQTANIFAPVILEANVESTCPFADYGRQNLEVCRDCSTLHKPCEDQYMACGGCACTDWHTEMNLDIKTHHSCPELKEYFKTKNAGKVKCEDADISDPDEPSEGKVHVNVTNKTAEQTLLDGYVETQCMTDIKCLYCDKVPFKLQFECDACNLGVPKLLKKCCDKCVEWVNGLANDSSIPANIRGFGWCSGCQMEKFDDGIPWAYAADYANYTEAVADAGMEKHIEENVCSLLSPQCGATTTTENPTFVPQDESEIEFSPCLHNTGSCNSPGGRRLEFLQAEEASPPFVQMSPNVSCTQFDRSFQAEGETTEMKPGEASPVATTTLAEASFAYMGSPFIAMLTTSLVAMSRRS